MMIWSGEGGDRWGGWIYSNCLGSSVSLLKKKHFTFFSRELALFKSISMNTSSSRAGVRLF
jgi:hypothetical protein